MTAADSIDLVCAGRLCVDLYAEQHGAPLDEVDSFRRYLGGSAGNICFGAARLGLKTAMLSRVGDDQNGQFVRRALNDVGVNTSMLRSDPQRLTPLVFLAVQPLHDFPRLFHYTDSADMATAPDDIDPEIVAGCAAILITGSFLANETVKSTTHRLIELVRAGTGRIVLDIDYRPVLWKLAKPAAGNDMLVMADPVTRRLQEVLPACDLVVGTEEEIRIAGGDIDLGQALTTIRQLTDATIVMKVGARGCMVFDGPIRRPLDTFDPQPGFAVEVVNTVGAGDGFFAGFLSGWLRNETIADCARRGNAVGALVVSRHGCSVAMPSAAELNEFLHRTPTPERPASDLRLEQLHRRAANPRDGRDVHVLAIDHRWQLEAMTDDAGVDRSRIPHLKSLLFEAFEITRSTRSDVGILLDDTYGRTLLERATGQRLWLARALDVPRSRPVEFTSGTEVGLSLRTWPVDHIAKLMVYAHPNDPEEIAERQWDTMAQLTSAAIRAERSFLIEFQCPHGRDPGPSYLPRLIQAAYVRGITPDWWKLPPIADADQWRQAAKIIAECDSTCHGMLVLGQNTEPGQLDAALAAAASEPKVRGFAIGRAIFGHPVRQWLAGTLDDAALVSQVASRFLDTISTWQAHR